VNAANPTISAVPGSRPSGVYLHVPHCRRRCPYCDFAIEVGASTDGFVEAVAAELDLRAGEVRWPVATLSLGGGTPSQLPVAALAHLVSLVRQRGLASDAEVALEVNPEDIDGDYARGLVDAGFTRVSVGLQSFDEDVLRYLGRAHDRRRGLDAVDLLVRTGLHVGVDLIVGVPGEGDDRLADDVATARDLGVGHLSTYILTLEADTPLVQLIKRGARAAIDDDHQADAYERVVDLTTAAGFAQYEISSHARAGRTSRHNRLYWQRGDYLGLGPGAHSFRVDDDGFALRRHTTARLQPWREALLAGRDAEHDDEVLDHDHAFREAVAFGLRDLGAGVVLERLAALHHAVKLDDVTRALRAAVTRDDVMVNEEGGLQTWRLTARGARFADRVARDVLGT
jgi:oxygen-independent coproporphyrinogen-3 oxidase